MLKEQILLPACLVAGQAVPTQFDYQFTLTTPSGPSVSTPMTTFSQWDAPITMPSTTVYPIITEPVESAIAMEALNSSAGATGSTSPNNVSITHLERCIELTGGVQSEGAIFPGCGAMFQHIIHCYDASSPWKYPYDAQQSATFQSCLCETNASTPFMPSGNLWRNFTGCSSCMLQAAVPFNLISGQLDRIQNFCSAEEPVAYLFIRRLLKWINGLDSSNAQALTPFPLTGSITLILTLEPLFTVTPPLANIAWGASAPMNGYLRGMSPSLTTYTTTQGTFPLTGTSLVSWINTATITSVAGVTATADDGGAVSSALVSALTSVASPGSSASTATQRCFGGCSSAASSIRTGYRALMRSVAMAMILAIAVVAL